MTDLLVRDFTTEVAVTGEWVVTESISSLWRVTPAESPVQVDEDFSGLKGIGMESGSLSRITPEFADLIYNLKEEYAWVLDELAKR